MNILLVGKRWDALASTLEALSSLRKMTFLRLDEGGLREGVADIDASLILASPDYDCSSISKLRDSDNGDSSIPPVLMCITHDALENDELYEGVDDIVVIPCSAAELYKRARRLALNGFSPESSELKLDGISLDLTNYRVSVDGKPVRLAWMEFQLLKFLMENSGRIFTREELLANVWNTEHFGQTRTVDVHVRRLRHKLGPSASIFLRTVTNVGYGLVESSD